jgi:hypothetical protein
MLILLSLLTSKFKYHTDSRFPPLLPKQFLTRCNYRQHPAVLGQGAKVFVFVAQALETDALAGQTAARVVAATKMLLAATNTDPTPLLQQFSPEAQQTIRRHFG